VGGDFPAAQVLRAEEESLGGHSYFPSRAACAMAASIAALPQMWHSFILLAPMVQLISSALAEQNRIFRHYSHFQQSYARKVRV
jgi:hypothetical protein